MGCEAGGGLRGNGVGRVLLVWPCGAVRRPRTSASICSPGAMCASRLRLRLNQILTQKQQMTLLRPAGQLDTVLDEALAANPCAATTLAGAVSSPSSLAAISPGVQAPLIVPIVAPGTEEHFF